MEETEVKKKCVCCENEFEEDMLYPCDNGVVCDDCQSDDRCEPSATVFFGQDDEPQTIGHYHNDTEDAFKVKWVSTDAWRGHFDVESEDFVNVRSDCILSYSADAAELKEFDDAMREYCDENGIDYARVFTRTSNVFSSGYDFFVRRKHLSNIMELVPLVAELQKQTEAHRDEERFSMTALTGKDEFDEKDKILAAFAKTMFEEGG